MYRDHLQSGICFQAIRFVFSGTLVHPVSNELHTMSDSYLEEADCDFQKECRSLLRLLHILPFLGKFKWSNQENETIHACQLH